MGGHHTLLKLVKGEGGESTLNIYGYAFEGGGSLYRVAYKYTPIYLHI